MIYNEWFRDISIHALREESDEQLQQRLPGRHRFLSTPSARRATINKPTYTTTTNISIHALREESDLETAEDAAPK